MLVIRVLTAVLVVIMGLCAAVEGVEDVKEKKADPKAFYAQVSDVEGLLSAVSKIDGQGGTIVLLPGVYEIKDTIVFKNVSNLSITGSGWSTNIRKKGEGDAIVFEGSCWSNSVRNLVIDGDPSAKTGAGIVFRKGEWSGINMIDYCHIRSFAQSGIRFEGNKQKPFSSNTVSNCWFTNNLGDQLYCLHNNDFYITTNQFGAGGDIKPKSGVLLDHCSAGNYTMNYHWGNVNALKIRPGAHYNRIENNRFEESGETGMVIGDVNDAETCAHNIFTGNTFHTNSKTKSGEFPAIEVYHSVDTIFTSNQVLSWNCDAYKHKNGLVLGKGCASWIVKDNILRHNVNAALVYDKKAGHIVKDNIVDK